VTQALRHQYGGKVATPAQPHAAWAQTTTDMLEAGACSSWSGASQ